MDGRRRNGELDRAEHRWGIRGGPIRRGAARDGDYPIRCGAARDGDYPTRCGAARSGGCRTRCGVARSGDCPTRRDAAQRGGCPTRCGVARGGDYPTRRDAAQRGGCPTQRGAARGAANWTRGYQSAPVVNRLRRAANRGRVCETHLGQSQDVETLREPTRNAGSERRVYRRPDEKEARLQIGAP